MRPEERKQLKKQLKEAIDGEDVVPLRDVLRDNPALVNTYTGEFYPIDKAFGEFAIAEMMSNADPYDAPVSIEEATKSLDDRLVALSCIHLIVTNPAFNRAKGNDSTNLLNKLDSLDITQSSQGPSDHFGHEGKYQSKSSPGIAALRDEMISSVLSNKNTVLGASDYHFIYNNLLTNNARGAEFFHAARKNASWDPNGMLHVAAHKGDGDFCHNLIANFGAKANAQDSQGNTPLHVMINEGHLRQAALFIGLESHNIDLDFRNKADLTSVDLALNRVGKQKAGEYDYAADVFHNMQIMMGVTLGLRDEMNEKKEQNKIRSVTAPPRILPESTPVQSPQSPPPSSLMARAKASAKVRAATVSDVAAGVKTTLITQGLKGLGFDRRPMLEAAARFKENRANADEKQENYNKKHKI